MGETKVNETKPSTVKPKKMIRRTIALGLGIVCIVLVVVSLVGAVTYIMPMINDKDNTISSLNTEISQSNTNNTNLQNQNNQIQAWLRGNETLLNQTETWLNENNTYYNSQIGSLNPNRKPAKPRDPIADLASW